MDQLFIKHLQGSMQIKHSGYKRVITHLLLGGMCVLLYLLIGFFFLNDKRYGVLVIASGYLSLLLICITLLIGPLNLLRSRRNPVNLDLRRDLGIWAALTGLWHVGLLARGNIIDGQVLAYFWQGSAPLTTLFGWTNDAGLLATLLLVLLLALSNTWSLRRLKGKRWKQLQRLAYPLALAAVLHTFGFQYLNFRGPILFAFVLCIVILVLICQFLGIALLRLRQRRRARTQRSQLL